MHPDEFIGFPETSSEELARRIVAAGPGHRMELRIDGLPPGAYKGLNAHIRVVPAGRDMLTAQTLAATAEPDINDVFVCPGSPLCPPA